MKRLVINYIISVILLLLLFFAIDVFAWDTDTVHPYITSSAFDKASNLSRFLGDFGLTNKSFDSQDSRDSGPHDAKKWIRLGSVWEDYGPDHQEIYILSPNNRFFNHYFDPVNNVGLTIPIPPPFTIDGQISRDWAKGIEVDTDPDTPINIFDWQDARTYFYTALTSVSETDRNKNFALTFRSLGQVIHLLEDASQPGHVRNDPHVGPKDDWFLSKVFNPSKLEEWGKVNPVTITNLIGLAGSPVSLASYDEYFDELALFSNNNFFSDDTMFISYASPSRTDTNYDRDLIPFGSGMIADIIAEDGTIDKSLFVYRITEPAIGTKLAQIGYLGEEAIGMTTIEQATFHISDIVAFENANVLIPKAVEYSSGLLNYFFRGEVGIVAIEEVITGQNITGLNLTIKNLTTNEDMSNGNVEVAYRYKPQGATVFTYGLSNMVASSSIPYQSDAAYTFTFSNPIPVSATEVQYTYVFKGTLGQEVGAVVGKVATIDNTGFIFTSGGDSFDLASPGNGGNVTMEAGVVMSPIAAAASLIVPYGSTVTLSGVQEFLTIQIDGTVDATSSLTLRASTGFFLNKGGLIKVENGIDGGPLTIESEGTIAINGVINTSGKNAASGNGGNGGNVTIRTSYTEPLQVPTIITRGGDTDTSDCPNRQVNPPVLCTSYIAGNGGDIVITSAGDIIFSGAATDDSAYIHDTLPPPPPYTLGTPDKPRPDPGERLPLLITDFRKGLLTSGGIGGSGTGSGFTAGGGGTGGDGGKIYISSTGGDIIFRDIDLFTGGDIEAVEADIYLPSVGQYPFFAYTGSLGGKGTGGGGARGADGGMGGRGGDIEIAQGQLNPLPVSFTSTAILGHNGENPNYYDNVYIGKTVTAFDTSGRQLYRLKVFDDGGVDKTLGGSGGFPGGSVFAFPGWFGLRGVGGTIINLPTM